VGVRWWTIGTDIAARTSAGTGVGPGVIRRYRMSGIGLSVAERVDAGRCVSSRTVEALLAFGAALIALRFAGDLLRRYRIRRAPELAAWAASLLAYAAASGALAWGAAAGWGDLAFRVYYLFGGLLTAALLGAGSLLFAGKRWAGPVALLYTGLAVGVALATPLSAPVGGESIPEAQAHLDFLPARLVAILGNSLGTIAVVAVALMTFRRRPLANSLILAGTGVAAAGSALAGLGAAETGAFIAVGVLLLYAGFRAATGESLRLRDRAQPRLEKSSPTSLSSGS
jgi:hypothetical protein